MSTLIKLILMTKNLFYLLIRDLTDDFGTKDSVLADISKRAPVSSISVR